MAGDRRSALDPSQEGEPCLWTNSVSDWATAAYISESGDIFLWRRLGRGEGRDLGGLPGSLEVMADGVGVGDGSDDSHLAAAVGTDLGLKLEDTS